LLNNDRSFVVMFFLLLVDLDIISVRNSYWACKWINQNIAVVETPDMIPENIHKLYQELSLSTSNVSIAGMSVKTQRVGQHVSEYAQC
jgi:hypothetical protein